MDRRASVRLVASVEAALYDRYREGHTWIDAGALGAAVGRLLGNSPAVAEEAIARAVDAGAAFQVAGGFQPAGACAMERYVASRIRDMLDIPAMGDLVAREVDDGTLAAWVADFCLEEGLDLDPEQREAVRIEVQERFGLVVGGAGVGKTTVLKALCAACEAFGRVVHLTALAGRAAVRMREATGRPSMTIAAFLRRAEGREIVLGPESLVVVDEASMVDLPTVYSMLRWLPDGARLLLVGDPAQLPPIGFGLVLHALVEEPAVPKVELRRVYRQGEATGIPAVARSIRSGVVPALPAAADAVTSGVAFLPRGDLRGDDILDILADLGGFQHDVRVLCATRGGAAGVEAINACMHKAVARRLPTVSGFAVGEPVMFLKNDYRRDLRNGSLGVVVSAADGVVAAQFDGVRHEFGGPALDDLTLAYAITVHKSQGSQFRRVVAPIVPTRLLDRSLVYTTITRAIESAVLVGSADVLASAVAREQSAARREVALAEHFATERRLQ